MGIMAVSRKLMEKAIDISYSVGIKHGEKKKIKDNRRQKLVKSVTLTDNEKESIDTLFKTNYGKKMPYDWHRLYQSFTGKFQEKYFPEILFSTKFEPVVNPRTYRYVLDDKILLPLFCCGEKNVRIPKTIATYCNGVYFDADHRTMSLEQLVSSISDMGRMIIKPTQDTNSGQGVRIISVKGGHDELTNESMSEILSSYSSSSFIIQEVIKPHLELKTLYPDAINTFRIVTYLWKGKVCHWPLTLRIGQGGSFLDNAHAGGMFINVSEDGRLNDKAFTEFQKVYTEHPDTHVKYEGYRISFVQELLDAAKRMHLNAPQLGVISWDLTMDEDGLIVLIEVNTQGQTIWFPQMASGEPAFGDNTEDVLKYIKAQ